MMSILKKLENISLSKYLNKTYQVLILLVLSIILFYNFNIIFLLFYLFILILFIKRAFYITIVSLSILIVIILFILCNNYQYEKRYNLYQKENEISNIVYLVNSVTFKNNYQLLLLKKDYFFYQIYLYDSDIDKNILPGSVIKISGNIEVTPNVSLKHSFSYYDYLKSNKIIGKINITNYQIIQKKFHINLLSYKINEYFNNNYSINTSIYLKALLIGDKTSMDSSIEDDINKIGISHLFVVSGLHVSIFVLIISSICKVFKLKESITNKIIIIILFLYLLITNVLISVFRVFLAQIFKFLNKDKQINTFNLFSINLIIAMILFPNIINSYSFILTYLISGMILLSKEILKNKSKITQGLLISIVSTLSTLPIIINISSQLNFLSIIYNLFYIPLMSYFILPLSIIIIVFPFLNNLYNIIIELFNSLVSINSNINLGIIIFPKFNALMILIYYFIFYSILCFIENKNIIKLSKTLLLFILILFVYQNKQFFNLNKEINFLNLSIGDSTLIKYPNNTCNILIDTGENEEILLYLKKEGIKRIDYLIISHGDSDHNFMMKDIINELRVKNVIISIYDNISLSYIKQISKKVNLIQLKAYNELITKHFNLILLNPINNNQNINDNSLTFILNLQDITILFTGDISKNIEEELIKNFKIDVDILKVAHHGSATSSSKKFLDNIKFKIAVSMNGYNNKYGFPNKYTLNNFKNKILLNTIDYGTVSFKKHLFSKKYKYKSFII